MCWQTPTTETPNWCKSVQTSTHWHALDTEINQGIPPALNKQTNKQKTKRNNTHEQSVRNHPWSQDTHKQSRGKRGRKWGVQIWARLKAKKKICTQKGCNNSIRHEGRKEEGNGGGSSKEGPPSGWWHRSSPTPHLSHSLYGVRFGLLEWVGFGWLTAWFAALWGW